MAGKLIVDTIDTDNAFITLNVQQSLIATMNVSGIYSNTGVQMIGANGTVSNTAITGLITASQIANVANTQITGNLTATTSTNLSGGGANTVVYQSAAGTTAYLTNGTTGQFLAATTSGAPTWGTPSAGALVLLSTVTASTSATVDIETTFSSTYDVYIIQATGVTVDTGNSGLNCRFKIGGSYIASGTPYSYAVDHTGQADTTYQIDRSTAADEMEVIAGGDIGSASTLYTSFEMRIDQVSSTAFHKTATWTGMSLDTGSVYLNQRGGGRISNAGALTGIRFFASSGNILAGKFRLYGVVNS